MEKRVDPTSLATKPSSLTAADIPWLNRTEPKHASPEEVAALASILRDEITFYEELISPRRMRTDEG